MEARIARWAHYESALLCQSGWAANVGLIQGMLELDDRAGRETPPIYIDLAAHASFWEGISSSRTSRYFMFKHNNLQSLEDLQSLRPLEVHSVTCCTLSTYLYAFLR